MMQLHSKSKTAYFCALALLFSYVEIIIPRVVPFFRFGLANIAVLLALNLSFSSFILISLIKAIAGSLMSGILFTPFFLISLAQSFFSAFIMYLLYMFNNFAKQKLFSVYGISVIGSAVSAVVQIYCSSIYLGEGTFILLGPMLIFNTVSGIITAFFSTKIFLPEEINLQLDTCIFENDSSKTRLHLFIALLIFFACASVFFINKLFLLTGIFIAALIIQKLCKRRIYLLPHISLWLFIFISTVFVPDGKIIFKIWNVSFTQGALITALQKSLRLSAVSAFSQCAVCLRPPEGTILALTLQYYRKLSDTFRSAQGNIFRRIKITLGQQ